MWSAIIVAAGSSRRAGFDKLSAHLAGQAVLIHSLRAFEAAGAGEIVLVCPLERWEALGLGELQLSCPLKRVDGGAERQDSVFAGLGALDAASRHVAIHDGARPLILPETIVQCLEAAREHGAAACAQAVVDTLKRADAAGMSTPEPISREQLWAMQTPQIFATSLIQEAYTALRAAGRSVTDEVSAMESLGRATRLVPAGVNLKITLAGDLPLAELIMRERSTPKAQA